MLEPPTGEKGPGVGRGLVLGLMGNIVFWLVAVLLFAPSVTSKSRPPYIAIGMVRLVANALLIWLAWSSERKALAKGLIIAASLAFLYDAACGGLMSAIWPRPSGSRITADDRVS